MFGLTGMQCTEQTACPQKMIAEQEELGKTPSLHNPFQPRLYSNIIDLGCYNVGFLSITASSRTSSRFVGFPVEPNAKMVPTGRLPTESSKLLERKALIILLSHMASRPTQQCPGMMKNQDMQKAHAAYGDNMRKLFFAPTISCLGCQQS